MVGFTTATYAKISPKIVGNAEEEEEEKQLISSTIDRVLYSVDSLHW